VVLKIRLPAVNYILKVFFFLEGGYGDHITLYVGHCIPIQHAYGLGPVYSNERYHSVVYGMSITELEKF